MVVELLAGLDVGFGDEAEALSKMITLSAPSSSGIWMTLIAIEISSLLIESTVLVIRDGLIDCSLMGEYCRRQAEA